MKTNIFLTCQKKSATYSVWEKVPYSKKYSHLAFTPMTVFSVFYFAIRTSSNSLFISSDGAFVTRETITIHMQEMINAGRSS